MKFAILGYGKMGKLVEELLLQDKHEISVVIDNEDDWKQKMEAFRKSDVAIDFSMPSVVVANMFRAFENHIPIVVGTTGWLDHYDEVREYCERHCASLVYGSNFSIGANLFMQLNKDLAMLMEPQSQYTAWVEETHHTEKKDAPSGTAIRLAEDLLQLVKRYSLWELTGSSAADDVLPIQAHREGTVPGIHTIHWDSPEDEITITHTAHNRKGFARGAIKAAIWLTRHSGIFDFQRIALELNNGQ